mgnify:CR=1 FL=1
MHDLSHNYRRQIIGLLPPKERERARGRERERGRERKKEKEREQNIERNREIKYERNTETYRAIILVITNLFIRLI